MQIRGCEPVKSSANAWKWNEETGVFKYKNNKCLTRKSNTEPGNASVEGIFYNFKLWKKSNIEKYAP